MLHRQMRPKRCRVTGQLETGTQSPGQVLVPMDPLQQHRAQLTSKTGATGAQAAPGLFPTFGIGPATLGVWHFLGTGHCCGRAVRFVHAVRLWLHCTRHPCISGLFSSFSTVQREGEALCQRVSIPGLMQWGSGCLVLQGSESQTAAPRAQQRRACRR